MTVNNPSFLVKSRHGIWYFQIQIPKLYRREKGVRKLFRRSLKTSNRQLALKLARKWWLIMDKYDFEWEKLADEDAQLYHRGKIIYNELEQLDQHDTIVIDDYFLQLTPFDEKALQYYSSRGLPDNNKPIDDVDSLSYSLSELSDKFIDEKSRNWGEKQKKSTKEKDYLPKIKLFIEIIGDIQGDSLTKKNVTTYKEALLKLPANKNKKKQYRDKSIDYLLNIQIPEKDRLSNSTIKNSFVIIRSFLKWLGSNDYSAKDLEESLDSFINATGKSEKPREIFSENDLKSLFNNDYYFRKTHKQASHYWIPLLALFTGARLNELCQLYVCDIKEVDGVWVVDINDEKDKIIKTTSSKRQVPIHSILIRKLKFTEFAGNKRNNDERLFPELEKGRDGYGKQLGRWFNRTYMKNNNVGLKVDEDKVFHSFRHTFSDYYKQLGNIEEYRVAEILGHKSETTSITYNTYGKMSPIKRKKELIELLKYKYIEFDKFRKWV